MFFFLIFVIALNLAQPKGKKLMLFLEMSGNFAFLFGLSYFDRADEDKDGSKTF